MGEWGIMKINYWDCEYGDYNDGWDGNNENPHYGCTHPFRPVSCPYDNKYDGDTENCILLDISIGTIGDP